MCIIYKFNIYKYNYNISGIIFFKAKCLGDDYKMINNKSVKKIIPARYSVRNYNGNPLSEEIVEKIESYIKGVKNPFNKNVSIKLLKKHTGNESIKLGTYGAINGAEYFLAAVCEKDDFSLVSLGYSLEKVILYCTSLGLGTLWLGGTFNKSDFARAVNLKDNEIVPIVAPVGYEGGRKSLFAIMAGNNKNKRKVFSELFFNGDFNVPLSESDAKEYYEPLEMLRLAPSAYNKQPWRVLKDGNNIHFYVIESSTSSIDIGIALCHFHLTAMENKLEGEFKVIDSPKESKNLTYVISWIK